MKRYRSHSWLHPAIEVRPSAIAGSGLFARTPIAAGTIVAILGGKTLDNETHNAHIATRRKYSSLAIDEDRNLVLDDNDPVTFGNHSCDPNVWMADEVTLAARRNIVTGEELRQDYATHTVSETWRMECACGSPLCRQVITGNDWRLPVLQARYRNHFSPFINRRIAALSDAPQG